jgi:hypothetical protein
VLDAQDRDCPVYVVEHGGKQYDDTIGRYNEKSSWEDTDEVLFARAVGASQLVTLKISMYLLDLLQTMLTDAQISTFGTLRET